MNLPFAGGCSCGAIKYECTAAPLVMFKCHCRDCQRATGAGAACVVLVPLKAYHVTQGQPSYHLTAGLDGEPNKRGYCSACGSPISGGETEKSIGIHAGSLDDPSLFRPQFDIHVVDAQPWDTMDPSVPKHELYPDV